MDTELADWITAEMERKADELDGAAHDYSKAILAGEYNGMRRVLTYMMYGA